MEIKVSVAVHARVQGVPESVGEILSRALGARFANYFAERD